MTLEEEEQAASLTGGLLAILKVGNNLRSDLASISWDSKNQPRHRTRGVRSVLNRIRSFAVVPTAIALLVSLAGYAQAQAVLIAANSPTVTLRGVSGGPKKSSGCAGFVANTPNHVVQVTEDSNLRFSLQAAGEPTLMISGPSGQTFCVQADSLSGGRIDIPGRWNQGNYTVFVGDRNKGQQSPYTLSISPGQN